MSLLFEWDARKAATNLHKHGVSFEEASTAFGDVRSLTIEDIEHSYAEERYILMGMSAQRTLLVVVHCQRGDNIRIISARRATRRERTTYEES